MVNQVVWFDIPVIDLERAKRFYSNVLNIEVKEDFPDMPVGVFSHDQDTVSGCVFKSEAEKPSDHGLLLYFNANGRLDEAIEQVEEFGGKVIKPKHSIAPFGNRAIVLDSEGNRIALHSEQ